MTSPIPSPVTNVVLISLGCAKNLVDSEVMLGYLKRSGYRFVQNPEAADIVIVNTCGFIRPARDEASGILKKLDRLKKKRPAIKLAVTGCYVAKDRDFLEKEFPAVDVWLGVGGYDAIVDAIEGRTVREPKQTYLYDHTSPRVFSTPPGWAYLKISEGCSHRCAFCSIPIIKGPYHSRSLASIAAEASAMAGRGIKEINLVSQDTTYFGRERGLQDGLAKLCRRLLKVRGIEWIRILYGYPEEISDGLLEVLREPKVCSYLDIPFQHADPAIIKRMSRGTDGRKALKLLEKIRKKVPDIAIRTSLIVGFPGEGAKEFQALMQFVREARFSHLGVFPFSKEPATPAEAMPDPLSQEEKDRRCGEIMELQAGISRSWNQGFVGRIMDVLPEKRLGREAGFVGRTEFQAPEVDGLVLVETPEPPGPELLRALGKVEITGADVYDLKGRWIS
ncbi:MAG: 30S ribosomal protein S12 methylthiotransferase RimO [Candidatus Aminicenantales bacterium]